MVARKETFYDFSSTYILFIRIQHKRPSHYRYQTRVIIKVVFNNHRQNNMYLL